MSAATDHSSPGVDALDAPAPPERAPRFVAVRADLMPAEIITARAADRMRHRVLAGLAAVVAVLVLGYGFSWWQTHSARNDLSSAESRGTALNAQTARFAPLVQAQQRTAAIHAQLAQLMTGDLSWRTMLSTLRAKAPAGTVLTLVTGSVTTDGTAAPTTGGYSLTGGAASVGTLTLTGTARDKTAVAAYADRLATVRGLTAPTPTSVTTGSTTSGGGSGVTFTMNVTINAAALGGRYAAAATTGGN